MDGSLTSFLAGAMAGAVDTCITMPLDTIKTNLQINPRLGLLGCARNIVTNKGFQGLYSGFQPFVVQASGKAAVRFYTYGVFASAFTSAGFSRQQNPTAFSVLCGLGAGTCEAIFWTCPTERMKVLNQSSSGGQNTITLGSIVRSQGVVGLYQGVVPTAIRQASSVAVRFTLFERIRGLLNVTFGVTENTPAARIALISFLSGGIGGAVSVVVNNPVDVIKSKIQSCRNIGPRQSMLSVTREVYADNGIRGFYAGLSARIPRLFFSQAIQFTVVDQILRNLKQD